MVMNEEKLKILKMLEEKKISSQEAMHLLETLENLEAKDAHEKERSKTLKIRVYEGNLTEPKVNVNIPLGWFKLIKPLIAGKIKEKFKEKGYDIDMEKIYDSIQSGEIGKIVDVQDGDEKVEIYIE